MSLVLSKKELLSYSLLAAPLSIIALPLNIFLPTYYVTSIGLNITLVGVILFIARLSDIITDPIIGYVNDKMVKRFQSRKPLMILGCLILLISFFFLINPNLSYPLISLTIFAITTYLGWSMITIPYLTWSCEIHQGYYEKNKLNSFREISTILGVLLALIAPAIFTEYASTIKEKLDLLYIIFLVLFIPFFIITVVNIKIKYTTMGNSFSLKKIKEIYKKTPNLVFLQSAYLFNNIANAIPATLFLLFVDLVIKTKENSEFILLMYFISGILALPIWMKLSKTISKEKIWISSILLASFSFIFVIFLKEGDIFLFTIISLISGLSLGADMAFPTSIQGDLVNNEKENKAGLLFGIWAMITKLSLALAVFITFIILGLSNFDKNNPSDFSILTLSLLYGLLPVVLKLVSIFFIIKMKKYRNI